jgi:hypothetical protein
MILYCNNLQDIALWSRKGYKRITAKLPGLIQTGFGAVDPFCHTIFGFVSGTR